MSIFDQYRVLSLVKALGKNTLYREGSVARILRGPLRGMRYRITENSGWAPIWGGWEPAAQRLYERVVDPGSVVYDLGANTGIHSMLLARIVGAGGRVYAFEPMPDNVAEIQFCLELNRIGNVHVVDKAICDLRGEATFALGVSNKSGTLTPIGKQSGTTIKVSTDTIDNLIRSGMPVPNFIKMDVEGTEGAAVRGMSDLLRSAGQPILAIDIHTPEQDVEVATLLVSHGYALFRFQPNALTAAHLVPIEDPTKAWPDEDGTWDGLLAIPSEKAAIIRRRVDS